MPDPPRGIGKPNGKVATKRERGLEIGKRKRLEEREQRERDEDRQKDKEIGGKKVKLEGWI